MTASVTITIMDQKIKKLLDRSGRENNQQSHQKKHPDIDTQAVVRQTCKRYITFVCTLVFNLVRQTTGPAFLHSESGHRLHNPFFLLMKTVIRRSEIGMALTSLGLNVLRIFLECKS